MPTVSEFKSAFPEFKNALDSLVQAKLDSAARQTDACIWGATYPDGVMTRCADLLARTPYGRQLQLANRDGTTVYTSVLNDLVQAAAVGVRAL